jgi:hypothetical protein
MMHGDGLNALSELLTQESHALEARASHDSTTNSTRSKGTRGGILLPTLQSLQLVPGPLARK